MKISMRSLIIPNKTTPKDCRDGSSLASPRSIRGWECPIPTGSCLTPTEATRYPSSLLEALRIQGTGAGAVRAGTFTVLASSEF